VWVPYIGINFSILQIPFRLEFHGVLENFGVVQYGPKTTKKKSGQKEVGVIVRNWPCITKQDGPFWNKVTIIFVVVGGHVGNGFGTRQDGDYLNHCDK